MIREPATIRIMIHFSPFPKMQSERLAVASATTTETVKRKRDTRPAGVTASLSQMSLSSLPSKRQRSTTMADVAEETVVNRSTSENEPKYLKVPDQIFKEMLTKALTGTENIVQSLDSPAKVEFVRAYAHFVNNVFYLKLQQDFWLYYDTVCMSDYTRCSLLDRDLAKKNNMFRISFKTRPQLEKHRRQIDARLREAERKLHQHRQQPMNLSVNRN